MKNNNDFKLVFVIGVILILIIAGTVMAYVGFPSDRHIMDKEAGKYTDIHESYFLKEDKSETDKSEKEKYQKKSKTNDLKNLDYESLYLDYLENNIIDFSKGMFLCDLNDDKVPELFPVGHHPKWDLARFLLVYDTGTNSGYQVGWTETTPIFFVNADCLMKPDTFYENPSDFIGVYRHKDTGKPALIHSAAIASEEDIFGILTYDGEFPHYEDQGVDAPKDGVWQIREIRDEIMSDYVFEEDKIFSHILPSGEYGDEHSVEEAKEALKEIIAQFKAYKKPKYEKALDGEYFCYVHNLNIEKNEIQIIPVSEVTYNDYMNAINSDGICTVDGTRFKINREEGEWEEVFVNMTEMSGEGYLMEIPNEENPVSVVELFRGKTPVTVKITDKSVMRSEVWGYDEHGNPKSYSGGMKNMNASEFSKQYFKSYPSCYFNVIVKNNEVVYLDSYIFQR